MSVVAAPPERPPRPQSGPPAGSPPDPPELPRGGSVKRILLGCLIVLLASAATSALFVSGEIGALVNALNQNPSLKVAPGSLASVGFGGPQTLLLVGDDQRALTKYYHHAVLPHSNEMLLVRIDPNKPWISMMSIPRDLLVTINAPAGPITTRFNYAYTAGGIPLLLSTIKRVLGLSVNHVVVITFARFKRAVDEMGCVYSTIDRRYYHSNVGSIDQYQEINLQPGYQKLCGAEALQYVSYRHGDTALVRDARNQSFLLDVKKQFGPTLSGNVHKFEHIFGRAVQTDPSLHTRTGILDLLGTLISSSARRVRQVQFQSNLLPTEVTATPGQIAASVNSFLHGGQAVPRQNTAAVARAVRHHRVAARLPLVPTPASELAQARGADANLPFPLEYPRVRDQLGSGDPILMRDYLIHAPDGSAYPAYVAVVSAGLLGQFYDVQGMTWRTAPQFDSPEQTVHVAGRAYYLFYEGQHLKMVAWYQHGAVYWIRNTLLDSISNGALLAIAEQTTPLTGPRGGPARKRVTLGAAGIPARTTAQPATALSQTLGSVGGVLTLVVAPLLAIAFFRRRRELTELRAHLHFNVHREAQLTTALATGTPPPRAATRPRFATPPRAATPPSAAPPSFAYTDPAARPRRRPQPALQRRRPLVVGAGVVAIVAAGALGAVLLTQGGHTASAPGSGGAKSARSAAKGLQLPGVPVAVLNATSTPGAAHGLAQQLQTDGVKIATVGNLAESRPPGLWILYAPGARTPAERLARLLASRSPTIAPIDPVAQSAAGSGAVLVAVNS